MKIEKSWLEGELNRIANGIALAGLNEPMLLLDIALAVFLGLQLESHSEEMAKDGVEEPPFVSDLKTACGNYSAAMITMVLDHPEQFSWLREKERKAIQ